MSYDFTLLCYIRFFSGFLAVCLAFIIWKKKLSNGAIYLALFELAASIWAISDGFEAASTNLSIKILWSQIAYIGVSSSSVFFLIFSLHYSKHFRFTNKKLLAALLVIPLITIIIAFTNEHHKLLWREIIIIPETNLCVYYYGSWFWINIFYEYLALTAGIAILLIHAFKIYRQYRMNIWLLLLGSILPFCASILYVFKLFPVKGLDLTSISFIFSGIIIAFSLFRLKMFDIMPIAHKQVIDNLQIGMLVLDSGDEIIESNLSFNKISQSNNGIRTGSKVDEILSGINIHFEDFAGKNELIIETQITIDGELKYFEVNYQTVFDNSNSLICKIFTFNDITTKKLILDAIAESNNNRKIELIEKGMLIKDLNAYAHTVAHDLKTPINSMVGFSDLIKVKLLENDQKSAFRFLDIINSQSLKMNKIIDELLKLSTIRKEDIKLIPIESGKILNEAIKRLEKQISESKTIITKPDQMPLVMGYDQWIEEVWVNLISNAIKYGGNPPEITIRYEKISPTAYLFHVGDNGNGLSSISLEKIFEDFERLGREDKEGNGLGLAIVKRIVEKLGGQISVISSNKPGEGCVFSFSLPVCPTN